MARVVGQETVILNLASGTYFGLDEVGSRIWQLVTDGATLAEICETLLTEYAVPRETLLNDLFELVGNLQERGLVQVQVADDSAA